MFELEEDEFEDDEIMEETKQVKEEIQLSDAFLVLFPEVMYDAFLIDQERVKSERRTFEGHSVKVGASDISACARKSAYPILFGEIDPSLENLYRMRKGNIAEKMIEDNLTQMGIPFERQGEYVGPGQFAFIVVHPDLLIDVDEALETAIESGRDLIQFAKDNGKTHILIELKTANAVPDEPHDYWVRQVNLQTDYIATDLGIDTDDMLSFVYCMELNDGRNKMFHIPFEVEEVLIAQDDALSYANVIEDFIQFANGEKEHMEYTINDVNRRVGNLCSVCEYAHNCLGSGETLEFPPDLARTVATVREYAKQDKNIKAMKTELKDVMLNLGVKKGVCDGYAVTLKGGNSNTVLDESSYTDEEKLQMVKMNPRLVTPNLKAIQALADPEDEKVSWMFGQKHEKKKQSPISVMIAESKKRE